MMRAKPIQTTKWGTACAQCASAKAKCSGRTAGASKCDRCERLLKQCTDQVHRPRKTRQPRQQPGSNADNSQSSAFDSLASTPENPSSPSAGDFATEPSCSSSSVHSHMSGPMTGAFEAHHHRPSLARTSSTQSQAIPESYFFASTPPSCLNQLHLSPLFSEGRDDLDEMLLTKYRTSLMPAHPFVIVPDQVPASMLKVHRPFLMLCIRMVAGFEGLHSMQGQMQHVMDHLADRMFRQAERSVDLLMGIVVVLGWYHYHCMRHSQLNNLLCLAESLISDLGLNRRHAESRPADEKRLLLGVWYLRSSAAMYLQQLTSMPFSSYMRQCLVEVDEEEDHDLDEVLVYCVKLQYLTERVAILKSPVPAQNQQPQHAQEISVAMASSQEYLDKLVRDMPDELKTNAIITTHINTVILRLYEPQPGTSPVSRNLRVPSPLSSRSRSPQRTQLETTLRGTNAHIRSWFECWVQGVPVSAYRNLPSNLVFQLLYAVGSLIRSHSGGSESLQGGRSVSPGLPQSHSGEALVTLDRLVALCFSSMPDMTHFWAALGERYDEICSPADDFSSSEQGDDYQAGWGIVQQPPPPAFHSNIFVPPSRVGSVGPAGGDLEDAYHMTPPAITMPLMPATHLHPTAQWSSQPGWDTGYVTTDGAQMMVTDQTGGQGVDPQLWSGQDPNAYHHPEGGAGYFMG
ncbi:hypothetical protein QBC35DRAFT_507032 [Podospora australis]|uniref:Zn(2)-C6 fungal-type domain-containing protein n=1 Tax=Podospora australis TaxID=1536484 RepID=A0AAN6WMA7_9PEZI|nr:hypothetical protein QBC35DRAFT_507032 [Podospora australis]